LSEVAGNPKGYPFDMKPQPWRSMFRQITENLEHRAQHLDKGVVAFEDFFPEVTFDFVWRISMEPEKCTTSIGERVALGLMFGILAPERALSMLEAWITQEQEWKYSGVRGLLVDHSPLVTSPEEAYGHAQSIYEAWRMSV